MRSSCPQDSLRPQRRLVMPQTALCANTQYASLYAISHAVRISERVNEDPLKLEFLSSFRCKINAECWMLFCSTILQITVLTDISMWVFLQSSPKVKTSPSVIDQSFTHRWIYAAISFIYCATFRRLSKREYCASWVMQLYDSQRIIYAAHISLNANTFLLMAHKFHRRRTEYLP